MPQFSSLQQRLPYIRARVPRFLSRSALTRNLNESPLVTGSTVPERDLKRFRAITLARMTTTYLCKPYVFTVGPLNHSRLGSSRRSSVLSSGRPYYIIKGAAVRAMRPIQNRTSSGATSSGIRAVSQRKKHWSILYFRPNVSKNETLFALL